MKTLGFKNCMFLRNSRFFKTQGLNAIILDSTRYINIFQNHYKYKCIPRSNQSIHFFNMNLFCKLAPLCNVSRFCLCSYWPWNQWIMKNEILRLMFKDDLCNFTCHIVFSLSPIFLSDHIFAILQCQVSLSYPFILFWESKKM